MTRQTTRRKSVQPQARSELGSTSILPEVTVDPRYYSGSESSSANSAEALANFVGAAVKPMQQAQERKKKKAELSGTQAALEGRELTDLERSSDEFMIGHSYITTQADINRALEDFNYQYEQMDKANASEADVRALATQVFGSYAGGLDPESDIEAFQISMWQKAWPEQVETFTKAHTKLQNAMIQEESIGNFQYNLRREQSSNGVIDWQAANSLAVSMYRTDANEVLAQSIVGMVQEGDVDVLDQLPDFWELPDGSKIPSIKQDETYRKAFEDARKVGNKKNYDAWKDEQEHNYAEFVAGVSVALDAGLTLDDETLAQVYQWAETQEGGTPLMSSSVLVGILEQQTDNALKLVSADRFTSPGSKVSFTGTPEQWRTGFNEEVQKQLNPEVHVLHDDNLNVIMQASANVAEPYRPLKHELANTPETGEGWQLHLHAYQQLKARGLDGLYVPDAATRKRLEAGLLMMSKTTKGTPEQRFAIVAEKMSTIDFSQPRPAVSSGFMRTYDDWFPRDMRKASNWGQLRQRTMQRFELYRSIGRSDEEAAEMTATDFENSFSRFGNYYIPNEHITDPEIAEQATDRLINWFAVREGVDPDELRLVPISESGVGNTMYTVAYENGDLGILAGTKQFDILELQRFEKLYQDDKLAREEKEKNSLRAQARWDAVYDVKLRAANITMRDASPEERAAAATEWTQEVLDKEDRSRAAWNSRLESFGEYMGENLAYAGPQGIGQMTQSEDLMNLAGTDEYLQDLLKDNTLEGAQAEIEVDIQNAQRSLDHMYATLSDPLTQAKNRRNEKRIKRGEAALEKLRERQAKLADALEANRQRRERLATDMREAAFPAVDPGFGRDRAALEEAQIDAQIAQQQEADGTRYLLEDFHDLVSQIPKQDDSVSWDRFESDEEMRENISIEDFSFLADVPGKSVKNTFAKQLMYLIRKGVAYDKGNDVEKRPFTREDLRGWVSRLREAYDIS